MDNGIPVDLLVISGTGGLLLSIMNLWEDARRPRSRRVEKDVIYWVFFAIWPVCGAFLTYVYVRSNYRVDPMLALITGLTAPTTIQALISKVATPQPGGGSAEGDVEGAPAVFPEKK